jgi:hypothetical protein
VKEVQVKISLFAEFNREDHLMPELTLKPDLTGGENKNKKNQFV